MSNPQLNAAESPVGVRFVPRTLARASVSSAAATALDYVVFLAALHMGINAPTAAFIGAIGGGICNFVLNRQWAFQSDAPWSRTAARYAAVSGSSALAQLGLVAVLQWTALPPTALWMVSRAICFTTITYPLFSGWVFPARRGLWRRG